MFFQHCEVRGVKLKLADEFGVRSAYQQIMKSVKAYKPDAELTGVLVCETLPAGLETIIGMTQDVSFGPAFMFGLGGIFVEAQRDVSFRVLPLTRADALEMIREIKGYALPLQPNTAATRNREVSICRNMARRTETSSISTRACRA